MTEIIVAEELQTLFSNYKRERFRFIQTLFDGNTVTLGEVYEQNGSTSIDFKKMIDFVVEGEPSVFLFLEKASTFDTPWVIIMYLPEGMDETLRAGYDALGDVLRKQLGKVFTKEIHWDKLEDFAWNKFSTAKDCSNKSAPDWKKNLTSNTNTNTTNTSNVSNNEGKPSWVRDSSEPEFDKSKPWSELELKMMSLNSMEESARSTMLNISSDRPTGWRENSLPLTSNAETALNSIKNRQVNWVQLSLINEFTEIECEATKTVGSTELSANLVTDKVQFYLYDYDGAIVLIHFIPEGGSVKDKMVYSTCKAPLSDTIKNLGISVVKKLEIREASDLTTNKLREETSRKTSTEFRVTNNMLRYQNDNSAQGRNVNPVSRLNKQEESPSSYRILTGNANGGGKLPKGVVLPPKGAY